MSETLSPKAHLVAIIREAREFYKVLREAPRHRSVHQLLWDAHLPWAKLRDHYHAVKPWLDVDFWAKVGGAEAAKAVPAPVGKALGALMRCREEILRPCDPIIIVSFPGITFSPPTHVDARLVWWQGSEARWYNVRAEDSPSLWDQAHCLAEGQGESKLRKLGKAIDALETALQEHMPACRTDTKTDTGKRNKKSSGPRNRTELMDLSRELKKGEKKGMTMIAVAREVAGKLLENCASETDIELKAQALLKQHRRYRHR